MNASIALLAPLALLLPSPVGNPALGPDDMRYIQPDPLPPVAETGVETPDLSEVPTAEQVRIEQRVIIRIAPIGSSSRASVFAGSAALPAAPRLVERKIGRCVPIASIAAVQPDAGRTLLLYMRDQRVVAAGLEKACSARDFYSGFYLARNKDGMLCTNRDKLHSRAGANCGLGRLRQLVAVDN